MIDGIGDEVFNINYIDLFKFYFIMETLEWY